MEYQAVEWFVLCSKKIATLRLTASLAMTVVFRGLPRSPYSLVIKGLSRSMRNARSVRNGSGCLKYYLFLCALILATGSKYSSTICVRLKKHTMSIVDLTVLRM